MLGEDTLVAGDWKKRQKIFFRTWVESKQIPIKHDEAIYEKAIAGKIRCDCKMLISIATYSSSCCLRICACLRLKKNHPECRELAEKLLKLAHKNKLKETKVSVA